MRTFPKISIVTPSFNQAEHLELTLKSVLDQGYPNLEYIVIDAGSVDGSVDIIRKYSDRLAYWVSEPDKGHADGINKGFARATGEIMGWVNSSDVYFPWTLDTVAQVFSDVTEARWITGISTELVEGIGPQDVSVGSRNLYDFLSGNYRWIQQESIFWKRELWDSVGGSLNVNAKFACDFELWLRFFKRTRLYAVNTILAGFRYHEDGRSSTGKQHYYQEAAKYFAEFSATFGFRDHVRAGLVRSTDNASGRLVRRLLQKAGFMGWYRHPRIIYDFDIRKWKTDPRGETA